MPNVVVGFSITSRRTRNMIEDIPVCSWMKMVMSLGHSEAVSRMTFPASIPIKNMIRESRAQVKKTRTMPNMFLGLPTLKETSVIIRVMNWLLVHEKKTGIFWPAIPIPRRKVQLSTLRKATVEPHIFPASMIHTRRQNIFW